MNYRAGSDAGDLDPRRVERPARHDVAQARSVDHPRIAVGRGRIDAPGAVGFHRERGAFIDAKAQHRRCGGIATDLRLGDESEEAAEPLAFLEMRVGDDALEQREMKEIALDRVGGAKRIGQGLGTLDAAVVHRAIEFFTLHREAGAGSRQRFAGGDMGVEDFGDRRSAPVTNVARLIAARDEDAVGLAQPGEDFFVRRLRAGVEDENLCRLDTADLGKKLFADLFAIRRADHDDVTVSGFAEKPFHRIGVAVAAAHQQQAARYPSRRRRVQFAEDIMFGALFFRLFRGCGRQHHAEQRNAQQPDSRDECAQHDFPSARWPTQHYIMQHKKGNMISRIDIMIEIIDGF